MWTREDIRREVAEAFKPDPPKPKPREVKAGEDWSSFPDEVIIDQAAKSADAQLAMAERWRDRRQEQLEHFPAALNRRDSQPLSPRRMWGN
jgi:hypothetical protein